ncbi:MAG TPA: hydrogenase 4 membrane subunit [Thermaerobacter sp.]
MPPGAGVIDSMAVLLLVTSLLVVEARRLRTAAYMYAVQSLVLVSIFLALAVWMDAKPLYVWSVTALATKVILIPYLLLRTIQRVGEEEVEGALSTATSVIIAALLVALSFGITGLLQEYAILRVKIVLAVSVAHFLLGLLAILTQKNALKQILGYCLMENGSHLTLALTAYNASETVEIGIVTDAVFAVAIMTVLVRRLHSGFGTLNSDRYTLLKG